MSNVPPNYNPERDFSTVRNNVCQEAFAFAAIDGIKNYVKLLESNQKQYAEDYEKLAANYQTVVDERDLLQLKVRELEHDKAGAVLAVDKYMHDRTPNYRLQAARLVEERDERDRLLQESANALAALQKAYEELQTTSAEYQSAAGAANQRYNDLLEEMFHLRTAAGKDKDRAHFAERDMKVTTAERDKAREEAHLAMVDNLALRAELEVAQRRNLDLDERIARVNSQVTFTDGEGKHPPDLADIVKRTLVEATPWTAVGTEAV